MARHHPAATHRRTTVLLAALLIATSPSLAAEMTISVSGDSVSSDCGAAKSANFASLLTGSLEGCLATFVQSANCHVGNGFDYSTEIGREEFDGTLDGKKLTFGTVYTFNAVWPTGSCPEPKVEAEIAGGCTHWVSGANVSGVIRFYDVIPVVGKGATNFFYEGTLTVSDTGNAAIAPVVAPTLKLAAAAAVREGKLRATTC